MSLTRKLVITYGDYVISTGNDRVIDGKVKVTRTFDRGSVEFAFFVFGTTASAFGAACVAAETAFRKPYQDLTVEQDGEDFLTAALQTTTTALDPIPEIRKDEDVRDTGRSRRYVVRIDFGLPANTGAEVLSGLRESSVNVAYDPSRRRTVTISGLFTAVPGSTARARYDAAIDGYVSSVLSALSISSSNRELAEEPESTHDINNKTITFSRVYEELIFSQGGASFNDTDLVRQRLDISVRKEAPGDTPNADRFLTVDLSYEAHVDATQTTDLRGKIDEIRDWLIEQMESTVDAAGFALTSENSRTYPDENRISVHMSALVQPSGSTTMEKRVTVEDSDDLGVKIEPAWTGDEFNVYEYQGPRVVTRTVTGTFRVIGSLDTPAALELLIPDVPNERPYGVSSAGGWTWIMQKSARTNLLAGLDDKTIDTAEASAVIIMRYVNNRLPIPGPTTQAGL